MHACWRAHGRGERTFSILPRLRFIGFTVLKFILRTIFVIGYGAAAGIFAAFGWERCVRSRGRFVFVDQALSLGISHIGTYSLIFPLLMHSLKLQLSLFLLLLLLLLLLPLLLLFVYCNANASTANNWKTNNTKIICMLYKHIFICLNSS